MERRENVGVLQSEREFKEQPGLQKVRVTGQLLCCIFGRRMG